MTDKEYRKCGEEVAEEILDAAMQGADTADLLDILDSSGFDGDIFEFI